MEPFDSGMKGKAWIESTNKRKRIYRDLKMSAWSCNRKKAVVYWYRKNSEVSELLADLKMGENHDKWYDLIQPYR